MAYNMYDATCAGFDGFVIVTRPEIELEIRDHVSAIIGDSYPVEYVHQTLDLIPGHHESNPDRTRPWGTGQAVICASNQIEDSFAVANADDLYGAEAFAGLFQGMTAGSVDPVLVTYGLQNTLSEHGGVNRGVCTLSKDGFLRGITEFSDVRESSAGIIGKEPNGHEVTLLANSPVSMNLWGLTKPFLDQMEEQFVQFLSANKNDMSSEFFLPDAVSVQIEKGLIEVNVVETEGDWLGVTFPSDRDQAVRLLRKKIDQGHYSQSLASDFRNDVI